MWGTVMFNKLIFMTILMSAISCLSMNAAAETYMVENTKLYIYAQSPTDSQAHLIRSSVGIYQGGDHPWCGNRAYINFSDKELFATALAASLTGKSVNFMYEDAAASKEIVGHVISKCRVFTIWQ